MVVEGCVRDLAGGGWVDRWTVSRGRLVCGRNSEEVGVVEGAPKDVSSDRPQGGADTEGGSDGGHRGTGRVVLVSGVHL